jgi:hypothetical protein
MKELSEELFKEQGMRYLELYGTRICYDHRRYYTFLLLGGLVVIIIAIIIGFTEPPGDLVTSILFGIFGVVAWFVGFFLVLSAPVEKQYLRIMSLRDEVQVVELKQLAYRSRKKYIHYLALLALIDLGEVENSILNAKLGAFTHTTP